MGKSKKRSSAPTDDVADDGEFDESMSCSEVESSVSGMICDEDEGEPSRTYDVEGILSDAISNISEKRGATRERAYHAIVKCLSHNVASQFIPDHVESMALAIRNSLRKGSPKEIILALHTFSLMSMNIIPEEMIGILEDTLPALKTAARDGKSAHVRGAAVAALAFAVFLHDLDDKFTPDCIVFIEDYLASTKKSETGADFVSYMNAWGLLSTAYSKHIDDLASQSRSLRLFRKHLSSDILEVRMAAGEDVAFTCESAPRLSDGIDSSMKALLADLATDSCKYRSKKDRKEQRSHFRDVASTVEGRPFEGETLTIGAETLEFTSWSMYKQLNALRSLLGPGLNVHLGQNDIVRRAIGLGPAPAAAATERMSSTAKRMFQSPNSEAAKNRTLDRSRKRSANRNANMARFIQEDED